MALTKGVNSYATQAEATAYFNDRVDVDAWLTASSEQKDKALVTATKMLDDMSWIGLAISEDQNLAFPRSGSYFDPRVGSTVYMSETEVPARLVRACFELALHLLNNEGITSEVSSVTDIKVGSINLTELKQASKIPMSVRNIVKPLLVNAGSSSWWRAN